MYHDRRSETLIKQIETDFRELKETIEKRCNSINQLPYRACKSEKLKYNWARKRSGHINKKYRIIYKVCEECRKRNEGEPNHMIKCLSCDDTPDKTVNYLAITDYH